MASSASSSMPSSSPAVGYQYESPLSKVNFSDIPNNIALASQAFKSFNEGETSRLGNQYVTQEHIKGLAKTDAEIDNLLAQTKKGSMEWSVLKAQKKMLKLDYLMSSETFDTRKQSFQLQNDLISAQSAELESRKELNVAQKGLANSQALLNDEQRKMLPKDYDLRYQQAIAQIMLSASQREVNVQQAANIFQNTIGQGLANRTAAFNHLVQTKLWPETERQLYQQGLLNEQGIIGQRINNTLNIFGGLKSPISDSFKQLGSFGLGKFVFGKGASTGVSYGPSATYSR